MKKIFLLALGCLLFSGFTKVQVRQYQISPSEKSLLWEISGKDLTVPSYLFGTNHLISKNFADSLPVIRERFNTCKAIAGEILIDSSVLQKTAQAMRFKENGLDKIFTRQEYDEVAATVKSITKIELTRLNTLKPAAIEIFILSRLTPNTISPTNPVLDKYFQDEGKKNGDMIIGLESLDFQLDLFFNAPIEDQKRRWLFSIHEIEAAKKNINTMDRLYRQQDVEGINKMMMDTDREYTDEEKDIMLKNRNLNWLAKLPAIMKTQPTFIAVGAGHLAGEYGLINLLRLKGYTVSPVKI